MSRRTARQHAFVLVFQFPFLRPLDVEALATAKAFYYDGLGDTDKDPPAGRDADYVNRVTAGVLDRLAQIDGVIEYFLKDWELTRLNRVDLALLRLAIYEMLCEADVPPVVAINEAVELAKEYGADESPAFINGVLSNMARQWKNGRNEAL